MTATKEMERKALKKIQKIIKDLDGCYLATAFEGCFEDAETNIDWDAAFSWKQRAESLQAELDQAKAENDQLKDEMEQFSKDHNKLWDDYYKVRKELDKELDWHDCEGGTNMSQNEYEPLRKCAKLMSEDEAAKTVAKEFGFDPSKVRIVHEVKTYEADKHGRMRVKDTFNRDPYFDAWDWNYIRFDVAGQSWEMVNGNLRTYDD